MEDTATSAIARRGSALEISEGPKEAKLETGEKYKRNSRLATPVLPKAFSQGVRAAGLSGMSWARRKNVVFSAVESWFYV
jgi:hypothetical protein